VPNFYLSSLTDSVIGNMHRWGGGTRHPSKSTLMTIGGYEVTVLGWVFLVVSVKGAM